MELSLSTGKLMGHPALQHVSQSDQAYVSRWRDASFVFWDVDTQSDFILPTGRLPASGAEQIIANLQVLTRFAANHDIPVISSVCAHDSGDREFQVYPTHCLRGTGGQGKIKETLLSHTALIPNAPMEPSGSIFGAEQVIIEKQEFDVFTNVNIDKLLQVFLRKPTFVVYGIATEVCVKATVVGLIDRGHNVLIVHDAIRPLDPAKGDLALKIVSDLGARFLTTREIVEDDGLARALNS